MKKIFVLVSATILSLIITFVYAEIFSLYHFGDSPTIYTLSYLISLFGILEYILLSLIYVIKKKLNKEKIGIKKAISLVLFFVSLMMILWCIILIDIDWLNYYSRFNSSPFYVFVIVRCLEFLLPSIILIIISIFLIKNKSSK